MAVSRVARLPPVRWRRGAPLAACVLVAVALAATGVAGLARAGPDTVAREVTVGGVPVLEVSPAVPGTGRPAAVVVHGFAGSATLMRGVADTLASRGYVVALPDLAGHGRNTAPLVTGDLTGRLQADLAAAVAHLRTLPSVDPSRIVLVGHSMGAGAVVAYAATHPDIRATAAISLGSTESLPDHAALPRNLLLVVGAAEPPQFRRAALDALHLADPAASFGDTTGDPAAGTARRAVLVPGTEHVSVLYATRTHAETANWLDEAVGLDSDAPVRPRDRVVPAGVLLLGMIVGFVPLAALLPRRRPDASPLGRRHAYPGVAMALMLAVAGAPVLPTTLLPLAVGGYAAGLFVLAGAGMVATWWWGRRAAHRPPALAAPPRGRRDVGVAALLVGYAAVAVAVPVHLGVTHAVPAGDRRWLLPVVVACVAVFLTGTELVSAGTRWRQPLVLAATGLAVGGAVVAGLAPGFLVLVLPLLVLLFAWHLAWSAVLRHRGAPVWLRALDGATVVGWPVAVTLPLT